MQAGETWTIAPHCDLAECSQLYVSFNARDGIRSIIPRDSMRMIMNLRALHEHERVLREALETLRDKMAGGPWHSRTCVDIEEFSECICGGNDRRTWFLERFDAALEALTHNAQEGE